MIHRRSRCHFAPVLTTHAVRKREEPAPVSLICARGGNSEKVLVVAADFPRIGMLREFEF
jgi:hypothetical protein